ncbi:diguanylate cyclase domain-containing protein [Pontibacillus salicampi]|uniref:Diguanylate cyclase domain-containing protein n=1 Tax=Pontibacillus salicampi TaxID=1449801 RepID=A0ABV6LSV9_9BACI
MKMMVWLIIGCMLGGMGYKVMYTVKIRRKLQEKQDQEDRIFHLIENAKDILYYCKVEPDFSYMYLSPSIDDVLGPDVHQKSMEDPLSILELTHPDDMPIIQQKLRGDLDYSQPILQRWRNEEGEYIWFEEHATPIYEKGSFVAIQGVIRNIHDKVILQHRLEYQITHDSLTGVHNRDYFESQMKQSEDSDQSAAIILCDLDNLKYVNDTEGHKKGDQLIQEAASLLHNYAKPHIKVCRIGGDEFALLATNLTENEIEQIVTSIKSAVSTARTGLEISVGYAYSLSSRNKMDQLYIDADHHMYKDKKKKRMHV